MINTTDKPIILTDDLAGAIGSAFDAYSDYLVNDNRAKESVSRKLKPKFFVSELFLTKNLIPEMASPRLVESLLVFIGDNKNFPVIKDVLYGATRIEKKMSAANLKHLRAAAKYAMFIMWSRGELLLPITFSLNKSISRHELRKIAPSLYKWCLESDGFRIQQHVPKMLLATSWRRAQDITMDDAIDAHVFLIKAQSGEAGFPAPKCPVSTAVLLKGLLASDQQNLSFSGDDLNAFHAYFAYRLHHDNVPFDETLRVIEERKKARQQRSREHRSNNRHLVKNQSADVESTAVDYLIYKRKYPRKDIFPDTEDLSFISMKLDQKAEDLWSGLMREWIQYRVESGSTESESSERNLRVLADYLAVCLPVSLNEIGKPIATIPACPKDFKRVPFMSSRSGATGGVPTFKDYVFNRSSSRETRYAMLNYARMFFDWVAATYGDEDGFEIAGPGFRNPIVKDDLPPQVGKKARSTNKRPFSAHVLPHLVKWMYAIESFGIHLQQQGVDLASQSHSAFINPADYAYEAKYEHLGKTYVLDEVRTLFVSAQEGFSKPSLTVFRMILLGIEVGCRMQSAQWLCKKKWDHLNNSTTDLDVYQIYINTNKGSPAYTRPILRRVRDLLLREQNDQASYGVEDVEIYYEDRKVSPYEKLVPLFRNINEARPYSDKTYARYWLEMLASFQVFYNPRIGNDHFIEFEAPKRNKIDYTTGDEKYPYCTPRLVPRFTPHSARSTFINRNAMYIEIGDIAKLVGHANEAQTSYYCHAEEAVLDKKMKYANDVIFGEEGRGGATVKNGPAFISAQKKNSAFSRSFSKDRDETIRAFGVFSLEQTLAEDGGKKARNGITAIDLLKASPASQIINRPTHICPVGERCPEEVLVKIGAPRRCGQCPYACKSIDNLPAIAAKQNELRERLRTSQKRYEKLAESGDQDGLGELWDAIEADTSELVAWELSEQILWQIKEEIEMGGEWHYHVEMPEVIRDHLERIVERTPTRDFMLQRIIESNAYPMMETPQVAAMASRIKRRLLSLPPAEESLFDEDEGAVAEVASLILSNMRIHGLQLSDISDKLERQLDKPQFIPLLHSLTSRGKA